MRLHHIEVTAFGPFSGSESVDFDALTDAGLFLLCGPTGAGKTSVLDAICFGLYGEVPGDRNTAKRLRSDHAPAGAAPSVVLEVSIDARRFRLRRSPAWQRPKRRGSGTTVEQAKVSLEELVDGAWTHHSSRLDETAHLVGDLLGMNVNQFCQVAMLPQGRFQSFLRARSDERHKVLQQLFRTSRFEDVERWLVARRQALKTADRWHQEKVASVVSRVSEAAGTDLPEEWDLHELAAPAEVGAVAAWAVGLLRATATARADAERELRGTVGRADDARKVLAGARRVVDLRARHEEAWVVQESLEQSSAAAEESRGRLAEARRASAVAPLLRLAEAAADAAQSARAGLGDVLADTAARLGVGVVELTNDALAAAEREARDAATLAEAFLPREAELESARKVAGSTATALAELEQLAAELEQRCGAIPSELAGLRSALAERTRRAAGLEAVNRSEALLLAQREAAEQVVVLASRLETAREQHKASIDVAQALRDRVHDVREARINGMSAELGTALASGDPCPVCGSADHPALARAVEGAPTRADEASAVAAYDDADFARQTNAEAVTTLERNHAVALRSAAGKTVAALRAELEAARRDRLACAEASREQARIETQAEALDAELTGLRDRRAEAGAEAARLTQQRENAQRVVEKVTGELAALFESGAGVDSVQQLIEARSSAAESFAAARAALAERDLAEARAAEAEEQASDCAREHGFESRRSAASAALEQADTTALEDLLRERETLQAKVQAVLSDAEVSAAVLAPEPDLSALEARVGLAEETLTACGARARVLVGREERQDMLCAELDAELSAWAPTRSAYSVAQGLSTFAEGKGADNGLQMRLSAYVLAARLGQVVAAANERLGAMSGQRYTLEHSSSRGVGELRGGLSLSIRDEWTGESRDPATLSGGETFVASLALALGLADVVTNEVGGSNIDTLFIDEGFGTLDPETLDDVMDTLDGLRDGGRVVGIVSHVPEMRTRITSQLQVRKQRSGSRIVAAREPA